MDVYIESNFVLEVALLQEQYESCEHIIELGQIGKIRLIVPSYSLMEPHETIIRYAKNRQKTVYDLEREVRQLSRSKPYEVEMEALRKVIGFLVYSQEEEKERLQNRVNQLLSISTVIPLDTQILTTARKYQIANHLTPQDSVVLASVISHLNSSDTSKKCFLNKNSKDFDDPDIEGILNQYGCKMLFRFDDGYRYIVNHL